MKGSFEMAREVALVVVACFCHHLFDAQHTGGQELTRFLHPESYQKFAGRHFGLAFEDVGKPGRRKMCNVRQFS